MESEREVFGWDETEIMRLRIFRTILQVGECLRFRIEELFGIYIMVKGRLF